MVGSLPRSLEVNGVTYGIRTDFRDVLKIMLAFGDPNLENKEKVYICLFILYKDFESIPKDDYEAAFKAALAFMDHSTADGDTSAKPPPYVMDWEQDENIMFPAINKVAGFETRTAKYVHWWTFMGYYMEISDGVFANVLNLRLKKAKGKKFEKWEREYWNSNKSICVLHTKLSDEEQADKDRLDALLG